MYSISAVCTNLVQSSVTGFGAGVQFLDAQPVCEGATKWNGASDEPVPRAGGLAQVRSKINIIHNQIQFRFCVYGSAYCFFLIGQNPTQMIWNWLKDSRMVNS